LVESACRLTHWGRDAITPSQDLIIGEHPHSKHLYIASGGSFHSWKFLPIIGKYAVQMTEGTLSPELAKVWAWDREDKGSAHERLLPHREMKDV
jgi:sarcosine oxidase/L-pipecolate oxidase